MDPYLDFAVKLTGIAYIILARDLKSDIPAKKAAAKKHRQFAKPGVLGAVYRLGAIQLVAYAEGMGIELTLTQAEEIIRVFRESYAEIKWMWYALEKVVESVLTDKPVKGVGDPNIAFAVNRLQELNIRFDKLVVTDRDIEHVILRMWLPSGRCLHYLDATWEDTLMPWTTVEGEPVFRKALNYKGQDQKTHQWTKVTSHGGKIFENADQAIARDVLAESLLKFEFEMGLPVVGHVHDEGITETEDNPFEPGVREMEYEMSEPIFWAPGLPLKAEGFEDFYYHK
jgi:DNA polymerase